MKILHVLDHSIPLHSGYTFRSRAIIREQRKKGWQTCHVTSEKQGEVKADKETIDGLDFYRTRPSQSLLSKLPVLNQWAVVIGLKQRIKEVVAIEKPDVIHAHSPVLNGLAAVSVGKELGIPVVYEVRAFWEDAAVDHGTNKEGDLRYRLTRYLETKVFKQADAITCICEGLKNDILGRGISSDKVTVIPNAVDISQFELITERHVELDGKLGLKYNFTLGFIGSFYAYEGLDLLVLAVKKLAEHGINVNCLMVGGGPQDDNLRRQVSDLQLEDHFHFTGRVPHSSVSDYYSLIDLLVYPRLPKRITELVTPLKPLEAMAQGRLFLASDVGGHHELVRHGVTGLLFQKGTVESLISEVKKVVEGQLDSQSIISNGLEYVRDERNWENSVSNYENVYEMLIK